MGCISHDAPLRCWTVTTDDPIYIQSDILCQSMGPHVGRLVITSYLMSSFLAAPSSMIPDWYPPLTSVMKLANRMII